MMHAFSPRLFTLLGLVYLLMPLAANGQEAPRNVILMIPDGFGPASLTMARDYQDHPLVLDGIIVGAVQTHPTDARVTDSAAGATAYACGVKSYNGAIAVDTLQQPLATVLEAAEARGMATGLVATSRITHATPAAFSAHVPLRSMEAEIAAQQLTHGIEVLLGGGKAFFLPDSAGGWRTDGRNLLDEAATAGYHVVLDRAGFNGIQTVPVLGLFTDSHMSYDVDRDPAEEPSIAEMTQTAINLLKDDPDGFFLMVEGSRIDHAAHGNDPVGHVGDILAYDAAVAAALDFARTDGQTLVISVADHETGGMTLGRRIGEDSYYDWRPEVLKRAHNSFEGLGRMLMDGVALDTVLTVHAGLTDLTEDEWATFQTIYENQDRIGFFDMMAAAISTRALIGWTTGGHTAIDVNLGAFGPGTNRFIGNHDNAYVGQVIAELLGFDLPAMTEAMRAGE